MREESFAGKIYPQILGFTGIYYRRLKENYVEIYFRGHLVLFFINR